MIDIISIITFLTSLIMGFLSKKSSFINNNFIPIQNMLIGTIIALINWIITRDLNAAIMLSGLAAGGTYDIVHNLDKIVHKTDVL